MILNAAGGECLDDFAHLSQDAVGALVGHELPSPEARNYTTQQIKPLLIAQQEHPRSFLPQTVPAYAATESFNYCARSILIYCRSDGGGYDSIEIPSDTTTNVNSTCTIHI